MEFVGSSIIKINGTSNSKVKNLEIITNNIPDNLKYWLVSIAVALKIPAIKASSIHILSIDNI